MERPSARLVMLAVLLSSLIALAPRARAATRWVCPPCGEPADTTVFTAAGDCPVCGMRLVEQGSAQATPAATDRPKVAILLFNGVEVIDSMGPYEVFGAANCDVYTVAASTTPVTSAMGATFVPRYAFADAPKPDVVVVPGGGVGTVSQDANTLRWLTEASAGAKFTMSVCNGAFILAHAGLLDGLKATTTAGNIDRLRTQFPKVTVVEDRRYVDNGRIITTGGLTAGIDGALHVVSRLHGLGAAQQVALAEEIDWRDGAEFARAALADRNVPDLDLGGIGHWSVESTQGTSRAWDIRLHGESTLPAVQVLDRVDAALVEHHWSRTARRVSGNAAASEWRFTGRDGRPWIGRVWIESVPEVTARLAARFHVERS